MPSVTTTPNVQNIPPEQVSQNILKAKGVALVAFLASDGESNSTGTTILADNEMVRVLHEDSGAGRKAPRQPAQPSIPMAFSMVSMSPGRKPSGGGIPH